ncbi:MAG: helix-turn-helix domain-containing protein [Candidatus Magasanikbacteria bacterium]
MFSTTEKVVLKSLRTLDTPLKISGQTSIPRPTVYFILEKLKTRGLVKKEKNGKKSIWLLKNSNETEKSDESTATHKNIKIYDSAEMIIDFLYKFVTHDTSRFQFLNGDHNPKHWGKYVETDDGVRLNNLIRDNKLVSDVISSISFIKNNENVLGKEWTKAFIDKPTEYHKLDSKYTNFNSQIILQKNKVFIMNMEKPVLYEISDPDIYKCFVSIFDFIKDHSPKVNIGNFSNTSKE